jgi:hypothetical protein
MRPFGENVEGFSHFRDEGCASSVQFEYAIFGIRRLGVALVIAGKPLPAQRRRSFQRLERRLPISRNSSAQTRIIKQGLGPPAADRDSAVRHCRPGLP